MGKTQILIQLPPCDQSVSNPYFVCVCANLAKKVLWKGNIKMCSRVPLAAQVNVTAASILVMLIVRAIKCSELELVKVAKIKS